MRNLTRTVEENPLILGGVKLGLNKDSPTSTLSIASRRLVARK